MLKTIEERCLVSSSVRLAAGRSKNSAPVKERPSMLSLGPKMPISRAMASAVGLVSPVIITTRMPAVAHDAVAELIRELKQSDAASKEKLANKLSAAVHSVPAAGAAKRLLPAIPLLEAMLTSDFTAEGGQQAAASARDAAAREHVQRADTDDRP